MEKPMLAQDLEEGDTLFLSTGQCVSVSRIDRVPLWIWVYPIAGGYLKIPGSEKVTLVHRPYPAGETEATMRLRVFHCCQRVLAVEEHVRETVDSAIKELQEAIEALELGR